MPNQLPSFKRAMFILNSPETSYWLRNALRDSLVRDAFDAANDAQLLAQLTRERAEEIAERDSKLLADAGLKYRNPLAEL